MKHKKLKLSAVFFLVFGLIGLQAQESVNATGGNAFSQLNKRTHKCKTSKIPLFSGQTLMFSVIKSGYLQNKPTLDSIIYNGYDNSGESWIPVIKEVYRYEIEEMAVAYFSDYWNVFESNEWYSSKVEITFNNQGDIVSEIHGSLENSEFVIWKTQQFTFSSAGLLIESIGGSYDSGTIIGLSREVYQYNENNLLKIASIYSRDNINESWRYNGKTEYEYNNEGNLTKVTMNDYDLNHDGLINNLDWRQTVYIYDGSGDPITVESQTWSEETNDWVVNGKTNYTYNNAGQTLNEKIYTLNNQSGELVLFIDDEWSYDSGGNQTAYYFREHEYDSDEWYTFKDSIIYDPNALVKDYTMPYDFNTDFECTNKPIAIRYYNLIDSKWVLVEEGKFFYSDDVATIANNIVLPKITVSQTSSSFSASWDSNMEQMTLDVFNLSGKKVYRNQIRNKETLNFDFLTNGIYLYKIYSGNLAETGKLLVVDSN